MIVEVADIAPGASYQGETFTQSVVVTLQDDTQLRVEDPKMQCGEGWIGERIAVDISADIAESAELVSGDAVDLTVVDPETGPGIEQLETSIRRVASAEGNKVTATLALPAGELKFIFNKARLPEGLPKDYDPSAGDALRLEGITNLMLENITEIDG